MDAWDAVLSRRNVRQYEDRPLADEDLERILEAGRRTPSSMNLQRWDFVVVTDRDQLGELAKVWRGAGHVARSAASIALVAPVTNDPVEIASVHYDLGQATMMMMLAATGLGVGSAHAHVEDQDQARRVLGLPDGRVLAWVIALGYPADRPLRPIKNPTRRAFDDVVHRGRY